MYPPTPASAETAGLIALFRIYYTGNWPPRFIFEGLAAPPGTSVCVVTSAAEATSVEVFYDDGEWRHQDFDEARAAINAACASLLGVVSRIEKEHAQASGLRQEIANLELQKQSSYAAARELADGLAAARKEIADAPGKATQIVADAKAQSAAIMTATKAEAAKIQSDAANAISPKRELDTIVAKLRSLPTA
jgi:hypothetical protein